MVLQLNTPRNAPIQTPEVDPITALSKERTNVPAGVAPVRDTGSAVMTALATGREELTDTKKLISPDNTKLQDAINSAHLETRNYEGIDRVLQSKYGFGFAELDLKRHPERRSMTIAELQETFSVKAEKINEEKKSEVVKEKKEEAKKQVNLVEIWKTEAEGNLSKFNQILAEKYETNIQTLVKRAGTLERLGVKDSAEYKAETTLAEKLPNLLKDAEFREQMKKIGLDVRDAYALRHVPLVSFMQALQSGDMEALLPNTSGAAMSDRLKNHLLKWEGFYQEVKACPAGRATIGYGCTDVKIFNEVMGTNFSSLWEYKGKISTTDADKLLAAEVTENRNRVVDALSVAVPDKLMDVLVSWQMNTGALYREKGTPDIIKLINSGALISACDELMKWNKYRESGVLKVSKGLDARRKDEQQIFIEGLLENSIKS